MRNAYLMAGVLGIAGCGALSPVEDAGREVLYLCAFGPRVTVIFEDDRAELAFNGTRAGLRPTVTASGARYASPGERIVFWTKGDAAMLELLGVFWSCRALPAGPGDAD